MLTVRLVAETVAAHYGVPYREIISDRRPPKTCKARLAVYWLARQLTPHSSSTIGRALGKRDHSTVLHGCATVDARRMIDAAYAADLDQLVTDLSTLLPQPPTAEEIARRVFDGAYITKNEITVLAGAVLGLSGEQQRGKMT